MSRWWGWWRPIGDKPTVASLQADLRATADRLAEVSGDRQIAEDRIRRAIVALTNPHFLAVDANARALQVLLGGDGDG